MQILNQKEPWPRLVQLHVQALQLAHVGQVLADQVRQLLPLLLAALPARAARPRVSALPDARRGRATQSTGHPRPAKHKSSLVWQKCSVMAV